MRILGKGSALYLLGLSLALTPLLVAGCGGGGGSEPVQASGDRSSGTLTLNLTFPATSKAATIPPKTASKTKGSVTRQAPPYAGNIPLGTKIVKLVVTNTTSGAILATRSVTAPVVNGGLPSLVHINFAAIPSGPVTVTATAYPDAAAQLNPIATGSASDTVQPLQTTSITVSMTLTLANISITPPSAQISDFSSDPDHTVLLNAVLVNAQGQPLVYPIVWTTSDPDIASLSIDPTNPYQVTITGITPGTSTITVYEPNSGLTATSDITVFAGG